MNIPENIEFYFGLLFLTVMTTALAVSIYKGQLRGESRNRYYGRIVNTTGMVVLVLSLVIENPDWLDETLLFIAVGLVLTAYVFLFKSRAK